MAPTSKGKGKAAAAGSSSAIGGRSEAGAGYSIRKKEDSKGKRVRRKFKDPKIDRDLRRILRISESTGADREEKLEELRVFKQQHVRDDDVEMQDDDLEETLARLEEKAAAPNDEEVELGAEGEEEEVSQNGLGLEASGSRLGQSSSPDPLSPAAIGKQKKSDVPHTAGSAANSGGRLSASLSSSRQGEQNDSRSPLPDRTPARQSNSGSGNIAPRNEGRNQPGNRSSPLSIPHSERDPRRRTGSNALAVPSNGQSNSSNAGALDSPRRRATNYPNQSFPSPESEHRAGSAAPISASNKRGRPSNSPITISSGRSTRSTNPTAPGNPSSNGRNSRSATSATNRRPNPGSRVGNPRSERLEDILETPSQTAQNTPRLSQSVVQESHGQDRHDRQQDPSVVHEDPLDLSMDDPSGTDASDQDDGRVSDDANNSDPAENLTDDEFDSDGELLLTPQRYQRITHGTAEIKVRAWRRMGYGKQVIVQFGPKRSARYQLLPATATSCVWSTADPDVVDISETSRGKDPTWTKDRVRGIGVVAWKFDEYANPLDLIDPAKKSRRERYPQTLTYVKWDDRVWTWEVREVVRKKFSENAKDGDDVILWQAKAQERRYQEYTLSRGELDDASDDSELEDTAPPTRRRHEAIHESISTRRPRQSGRVREREQRIVPRARQYGRNEIPDSENESDPRIQSTRDQREPLGAPTSRLRPQARQPLQDGRQAYRRSRGARDSTRR